MEGIYQLIDDTERALAYAEGKRQRAALDCVNCMPSTAADLKKRYEQAQVLVEIAQAAREEAMAIVYFRLDNLRREQVKK